MTHQVRLPDCASLERHPERGDTARAVYHYEPGGVQKFGWTAAGRAREQVDAMNVRIAARRP
jgi:hypothetical protein